MERAVDTPSPRATLDAWLARGADRANPARFRFIDALERRAARFDGEARRILDERLVGLVAEYAGEVERIAAEAASTDDGPARAMQASTAGMPSPPAPRRGALADLTDLLLASRATVEAASEAPVAGDAAHWRARDRSPDLPMLDYFRETWSRFNAEKQLRHALDQVPDNAGPLNSNSLVHRTLSLMRALSPEYLQQFLSYVEALSWIEQLAGPAAGAGVTGSAPAAEATRASGAKKSARSKAR